MTGLSVCQESGYVELPIDAFDRDDFSLPCCSLTRLACSKIRQSQSLSNNAKKVCCSTITLVAALPEALLRLVINCLTALIGGLIAGLFSETKDYEEIDETVSEITHHQWSGVLDSVNTLADLIRGYNPIQ